MIYTKKDIQKFYTKMVKENLEYGDINIRSMSGSQGEDSRIDINLGGRIRRVLIYTIYDIDIHDVIFIKIIDFMDNGSGIYWNDKGDLVQKFCFVPIRGTSYSKYYMVDQVHFDQARAKRKMRDKNKYEVIDWTKLDSKYYPIFKKIVQSFNKPGWKSFDIINVTTKDYGDEKYYNVKKYNGKTIILTRKGTKFYLN